MTNTLAAAAAVTIATLSATAPALAASYTLNCVDATTGQATTVTVEASSRAAAIDKVRNDPAYSSYDRCR